MRAINDYLIIDVIKEEVVSASGLIYDKNTRSEIRHEKGIVKSVSQMLGDEIKVGDTILFDKVRAYSTTIDGVTITIIRKSDVVLIF